MSRFLLTLSMVFAASIFGCSKSTTDAMKEAGDSVKTAAEQAASDAAAATEKAADSVAAAAEDAKKALGDGFAAASEKAHAALKDVAGGPELMKKISDFFSSAHASLAEIKDEASAKTASPKIDELIAKAGDLGAMTEKLPEEAKTAVKAVIDSGLKALNELETKIMALPGVETVIKPKLEELSAKIEALVAKKE